MNSLEALQNFTTIKVAWQFLCLDLVLTAIFSLFLKFFYVKFGSCLSNRARLANNFLPIAVTTAVVITIVKSSLALSLGLVGALSIVRFRTAIKDPEELSFLFLSIALGLGFGAGQRLVIILAFIIILLALFVQKKFFQKNDAQRNLHLMLKLKTTKLDLDKITSLIGRHSKFFDLQRMDKTKNTVELSGKIEFNSPQDLQKLTRSFEEEYPTIEMSFVDTSLLS